MKTVYWLKNNDQFYRFLHIYTFDESLHVGAVKVRPPENSLNSREWPDSGCWLGLSYELSQQDRWRI